MNRASRFDIVALACLVTAASLFFVWMAVANPEPMPPPSAPSSAPHTALTVYKAGQWSEPIVTYDAKAETLTISAHAPRTLLLCINTACDLVDGWRQK